MHVRAFLNFGESSYSFDGIHRVDAGWINDVRSMIEMAALGRRSMIVDAGNRVAQLRLLLVEPKARGQRVGTRLIDESIIFSPRNRYRKIKLWTQSNLLGARRLYEKTGFEKVSESPHKSFGQDLIAEFWELRLGG